MIFMTRRNLERLIESKITHALNEYRYNGAGQEKKYTVTTVYNPGGTTSFIEEVERLPPGSWCMHIAPRKSLPEMSLPALLNRIIDAAGIKLSIEPEVPASLKANCRKVTK